MINKLKNLFKDRNSKAWQEQVQLAKGEITLDQATEIKSVIDEAVREQYPANVESSAEFNQTVDPDPTEVFYASVDEMSTTKEEKEELQQEVLNTDPDPEYLKYSPLVLGYPDSALQSVIYRGISYYTGKDSILDYGCGRGDFKMFITNDTGHTPDYVGIDKSEALINAGKELYGDLVDIRLMDWSQEHDIVKDWAVNITGLNLRYDSDLAKSDIEYFEYMIDIMMQHAEKGVIVMISSSMYEHVPGVIRYNPGEILNKMQEKYKCCIVDHTLGDLAFALVIYKL